MATLTKPAPKVSTPAKNMVGTTLPPAATAIVDSLVGTFVGENRSKVLRFIVVSWITEHMGTVIHLGVKK